jgi:hypothetical protein
MGGKTSGLILVVCVLVVSFTILGAGQSQIERPPQPFFQDFFSGSVTVQGTAPPAGTLLIACINSCDSDFESEPYSLKEGGVFDQLEVNPKNEMLVGHAITFYLVNEFGRIQANEKRPYIGVFDFYSQNLTFDGPLPKPAPTPVPTPNAPAASTAVPTPIASLPIAGDPSVTNLPRIALATGGIAVAFGSVLLFAARRKEV